MPAALANSRVVLPSKPFDAKTSRTDSTIACRRSFAESRCGFCMPFKLALTYHVVKVVYFVQRQSRIANHHSFREGKVQLRFVHWPLCCYLISEITLLEEREMKPLICSTALLLLLACSPLRAQERLTFLYPSPASSWMIPVVAKEA